MAVEKKDIHWFLLIIIALRGCSSETPPNPALPPLTLKAGVDKPTATIGDLITYTVTIDMDSSVRMEAEEADFTTTLKDFKVVDVGTSNPEEMKGRKILKKWYRIRAHDIGEYSIPEVKVKYHLRDGGEGEATAEKVSFEVKSVIGDYSQAKDIKDIKPPLSIEREYWLWVLGAFSLLALACLGWLAYRRTLGRKGLVPFPLPPPLPPHVVARRALQDLDRQGLVKKGMFREYYFFLSEIVRRYLQDRFHKPFLEMTTEEITSLLREDSFLKGGVAREIEGFLAEADLVKFATHKPGRKKGNEALSRAFRIVEETKEEESLEVSQT